MNSETKLKQRPILFSTPMVQAILEGRKTVTRRTSGLDYINSLGDKVTFAMCEMGENMTYTPQCPSGLHVFFGNEETDDWWQPIKCPYGNVGDVLWIREEHYRFGHWEPVPGVRTKQGRQKWAFVPDTDEVLYFDNPPSEFRKGRHHKDPATPAWHKRLARFMPKDLYRTYLQITEIKVERLQEISEEDAKAEGITCLSKDGGTTYKYGIPDADGLPGNDDSGWHWSEWEVNPKEAFKKLWESINGTGSWNANPWVWAISLERIKGEKSPLPAGFLP
jgi:hypothetical protein